MNKLLVKVLLVCMILTCMSSGTLAVYTTTLDNQMQTTVTAKRFFIGVNAVEEMNVRLAPGESVARAFTLTNINEKGFATEVDMDVTIAADYTSLYALGIPGLRVYLADDKDNFLKETDPDGNFSYTEKRAFKADAGEERTFKMVFEWSVDEDVPITFSGKSASGLTMYITGTQHVD